MPLGDTEEKRGKEVTPVDASFSKAETLFTKTKPKPSNKIAVIRKT